MLTIPININGDFIGEINFLLINKLGRTPEAWLILVFTTKFKPGYEKNNDRIVVFIKL